MTRKYSHDTSHLETENTHKRSSKEIKKRNALGNGTGTFTAWFFVFSGGFPSTSFNASAFLFLRRIVKKMPPQIYWPVNHSCQTDLSFPQIGTASVFARLKPPKTEKMAACLVCSWTKRDVACMLRESSLKSWKQTFDSKLKTFCVVFVEGAGKLHAHSTSKFDVTSTLRQRKGRAPRPHQVIKSYHHVTIDSLSTKRKLQRKLKQNVTWIPQPMTDGGVANSAHWIGVHNQVTLGLSLGCK